MKTTPQPASPRLPPACPGKLCQLDCAAGRIAVYSAGSGAAEPMLLVHSANAAASAFEVRPLYEHFARTRPTYAFDLPGFGHSDRSDRMYDARLMTDAVLAVAAHVRTAHSDVRIDSLALSTGSEFLARAAVEAPDAFGSVALVSPTGFRGSKPRNGVAGANRGMPWLHRIFSSGLVGDRLFRNLTRPRVIRYFLEKTWGSKKIDEALLEYDWLSARMPGARHAPLYFVSGFLFSADIYNIYQSLTQPVWMSHGVRGDFTDYRLQRFFAAKPNWRFTEYPTGALPHFEVPELFMQDHEVFLSSLSP